MPLPELDDFGVRLARRKFDAGVFGNHFPKHAKPEGRIEKGFLPGGENPVRHKPGNVRAGEKLTERLAVIVFYVPDVFKHR
ncbi:MAG: hypothetical protein OXU54_00350 [Gammaproteobacteria bacterium]|nr:hypothetical protein [Gammaproteobacteria bacterium]